MNATRRTRIIAILPFAMCAIGTLVAFTNFMALQQYNAYHTLREEDLETLTDNADAQSRLLKKLALSLVRAPVGQLGPENTQRKHLRYYNSLFFTSLEFGMNAKSLIEVGCASDPFIQYLDWVDRRTCVAPYYVKYAGETMKNENAQLDVSATTSGIESIVADFMEFKVEDYSYDLLICSQVLEHVSDPSAFMKKLIRTAKTSIISVPFEWHDCGKVCNHKTNEISYEMLLKWSEPHLPVFSAIVREGKGGDSMKLKRRIIVVFQPDEQ